MTSARLFCAASLLVLAAGLWALALLMPPAVLWVAWSALLAFIILAAFGGAGRRLLERFPRMDELEKAVFGACLGLGLAALLVMAGGSLGWLKGRVFAVGLVAIALLFGLGGVRSSWRVWAEEARLHAGPWAPSGLLLLLIAWTAAVPPHQYDSLVYHLALPQAYLRQGDLRPVEGVLFSHFPQNAEMLFTLAMALGSDLAAQFLSLGATVLNAALVWLLARRSTTPGVGALAVFLFLSHTAVMLLAPTTYVEPWVGLWLTASLAAFARWLEAPMELASHWTWLNLAGVFSGLAFGTKYYAGVCPALLFLLATWRILRDRTRVGLGVFAGAAYLPALPWLLKNVHYTGNPVYPFLHRVFTTHGQGGEVEAAAAYFSKAMTEYTHPNGFWKDLLLFPYQVFGDSLRFGGGMDVLGDFGWPAVLLGAPLALVSLRRDRLWRFYGLYLGGHLALWFWTGVVLRFLVPVAGLLSLAAAQGYALLWERTGGGWRAAVGLGLTAFLAARLYAFGYVHAVFESPRVLFGIESPEAYLSRRLAYHPCGKAAGRLSGPNDKILIVGEARSYYVKPESVPTSTHGRNLYQSLIRRSSNGETLRSDLRARGFTRLMWLPGEAERLKGYGVAEELASPAWSDLLRRLPLLHESKGCLLYAVP